MKITLYQNDLPNNHKLESAKSVAIDAESLGLNYKGRDKLCLLQICSGYDEVYIGPISIAQVLVRPISAHLAATYGERSGNPKRAALDAMLMMLPRAFLIKGVALRVA